MMESLLTLVGFEQSDTGIDDQAINGAELLLGVQFPLDYRRIALAFDGAFGDVDFPLPDAGRRVQASIGHWLSLIPWTSQSVWSWLACWGEHQLPRAVIPIAEMVAEIFSVSTIGLGLIHRFASGSMNLAKTASTQLLKVSTRGSEQ